MQMASQGPYDASYSLIQNQKIESAEAWSGGKIDKACKVVDDEYNPLGLTEEYDDIGQCGTVCIYGKLGNRRGEYTVRPFEVFKRIINRVGLIAQVSLIKIDDAKHDEPCHIDGSYKDDGHYDQVDRRQDKLSHVMSILEQAYGNSDYIDARYQKFYDDLQKLQSTKKLTKDDAKFFLKF